MFFVDFVENNDFADISDKWHVMWKMNERERGSGLPLPEIERMER